jgi:MerR family transcriptional regulator, light-induced transcriptional regulator
VPTADTDATASFAAAVMTADRAAAESEARDLLSGGMTLLELYELLTDVMYDVGECWATGEMSVADEHQATATASYVVDRLRGAPPAATRGTVVLTSLEGERHLLGLSLLAHLLEHARFRAVAAGDLPADEIQGLASQQDSD